MMNSSEFYDKLSQTSATYNWQVSDKKTITATGKRGKVKGESLNPVTAVACKQGRLSVLLKRLLKIFMKPRQTSQIVVIVK